MKNTEQDYIKDIQRMLKDAGFYTGKIDGIVGQLTSQAVYKALNYPNERGEVRQEEKAEPTPQPNEPADTTPYPTFASFINETSIKRLKGVDEKLYKVVALASQYSSVPFLVTEGLRTYARQKKKKKTGASKTLTSNHLTGKAVDLAPLINGKISWEQKDFYPLAECMQKACIELGVKVRWGGAWAVLNDNKGISPKSMIETYSARKRQARQKPFIDCPHFELYNS